MGLAVDNDYILEMMLHPALVLPDFELACRSPSYRRSAQHVRRILLQPSKSVLFARQAYGRTVECPLAQAPVS